MTTSHALHRVCKSKTNLIIVHWLFVYPLITVLLAFFLLLPSHLPFLETRQVLLHCADYSSLVLTFRWSVQTSERKAVIQTISQRGDATMRVCGALWGLNGFKEVYGCHCKISQRVAIWDFSRAPKKMPGLPVLTVCLCLEVPKQVRNKWIIMF